MAEKLKVLLLGAAFSADLHMDGYSRFTDRAQVVAIADKDQGRVAALAARYGLTDYAAYDSCEKAIDEVDCDLVDICMPNFLHHAMAIRALNKGKHIISEKPLATTVEDAEEMVETARRAGKRIFYAEDWLGAPALTKAQSLIDSGAIGDILFVRARECHNGSHSPFAQTIRFCGGGSMIHLGIHPLGLILSMKNNEWAELTAMTSGGGERNLVHKSMEGEDWAAVIMRFKDGTTALLEGNYVTTGGMEDAIEIYGTKGRLHVDLTFSSAISAYSIPGLPYTVEKAEITTGWSRPVIDEKYNLGYVAEIAYFVDCAKRNAEAGMGIRGIDGLEALKVTEAIYRSALTGRAVKNMG